MQRRIFLKHAALTAASGAVASTRTTMDPKAGPLPACQSVQREPQALRIVDTHVHLWDLIPSSSSPRRSTCSISAARRIRPWPQQ